MNKNNPNQKENNSLLNKGKYSAVEIAKCLLSFDPSRQYFTKNLVSFREEYRELPIEGNFRLNKMLHMCQIFYCVKHGTPLFREPMKAYTHGAIVYNIYRDFHDLYNLLKPTFNLDQKTYEFVQSVFNYFYRYKEDNEQLRKFSHDDPAWELGREQEDTQTMPLNKELVAHYQDFFDDTLKEIEES